mmetsp:Transcript_103124/g.298322  ORF Transcript_103124/g.298322 Transcript_103124/m.298322 type:complete len:237 (+) Transcript_103124:431-1141(+)
MLSAWALSPRIWQSTPQSPKVSAISGCCHVLYFCNFSSRQRFCNRSALHGSRSKASACNEHRRSARKCPTVSPQFWLKLAERSSNSAVKLRARKPRRARQPKENSATALAKRGLNSSPPAAGAASMAAAKRAAAQRAKRMDRGGSDSRVATASSMSASQIQRFCVAGCRNSSANAAALHGAPSRMSPKAVRSKSPMVLTKGCDESLSALPQTSEGSMLLPSQSTDSHCSSQDASAL